MLHRDVRIKRLNAAFPLLLNVCAWAAAAVSLRCQERVNSREEEETKLKFAPKVGRTVDDGAAEAPGFNWEAGREG